MPKIIKGVEVELFIDDGGMDDEEHNSAIDAAETLEEANALLLLCTRPAHVEIVME